MLVMTRIGVLMALVASGAFGQPGVPPREPTPEERAEVQSWAPRLAQRADWRVTGEACARYNCFAWSVGVTDRYLWADGDYVEDFDRFYQGYGYVPLGPGDPPEVAVIATWAIGPDVTHAARRVSGDVWESKLGPSLRIRHRLEELEGPNFGRLSRLYRRAAPEELRTRGVTPIVPPASDGKDPCAGLPYPSLSPSSP